MKQSDGFAQSPKESTRGSPIDGRHCPNDTQGRLKREVDDHESTKDENTKRKRGFGCGLNKRSTGSMTSIDAQSVFPRPLQIHTFDSRFFRVFVFRTFVIHSIPPTSTTYGGCLDSKMLRIESLFSNRVQGMPVDRRPDWPASIDCSQFFKSA
jgi:hypothetical protein